MTLDQGRLLRLQRLHGNAQVQRRLGQTAMMALASGTVVQRDPLSASIPPQVNPTSASVSFDIPANTQLRGGWHDLSTAEQTTVTLRLTSSGISLSFSPATVIDVTWPVSDIAWSGLEYTFASASVTSVNLRSTQDIAFEGGHDTARAQITSWFQGMLRGTRAAEAGYDPLNDPNITETLDAIKANMQGGGASDAAVRAEDLRNVELAADLTFRQEIRQGDSAGGIFIPAGGSATIRIVFSGSAADMAGASTRQINTITIESSSITAQQNGSDVARLERIYINRGGTVTLGSFTPLNDAAMLTGGEALLRLAGLIVALGAGSPSDRLAVAGRDPNLAPEVTTQMIRDRLETALTAAVQQLIRAHCYDIPDVNLCTMLGMTGPAGDFPAPSASQVPT